MNEGKQFDPIVTSKKIESRYRSYIESVMRFDDGDLRDQFSNILEQPGFLSKGPFLEATPPYTKDKSLRELVDEGLLCEGVLKLGGLPPERKLYRHQVEAIRRASEKKNYVVVTGTGSGKTECFLIPIINDIMEEFQKTGPQKGVRAMILYPMNALANDQMKRLRTMLAGTDITFGRYTGDTEERDAEGRRAWRVENQGAELLPNEIVSREAIRSTPPNILLTNYSMLEYLLLRPKDAPLFSGAFGSSWRHIAIDEAHIYSGTLGTEIAFLLRRLKARIAVDTGRSPRLQCYATSATIGSESEMHKVAQFAEDLFGEPFSHEVGDAAVVVSTQDSPESDLVAHAWGCLPPELWTKLRRAIARPREELPEAIRGVLDGVAPESFLNLFDGTVDSLQALGSVLLAEESSAVLIKRVQSDLVDLSNTEEVASLGIRGISGDERGVEALSAMVEVLSAAKRPSGAPVLASRYHSFLSSPQGLYINLRTKRLSSSKKTSEKDESGSDVPVYELSVCRRCGQGYILGVEKRERACAWLDPRHEGTDADDEFVPRVYYRLLEKGVGSIGEVDGDEQAVWLCPACGSLHSEKTGGPHRFAHPDCERVAIAQSASSEESAKCRHCGYMSVYAIQPLRVSPEAVGNLICYELVRDVPPFESEKKPARSSLAARLASGTAGEKPGSIICFSDKRQDAAYFAPAMSWAYDKLTKRQMIYEALGRIGACEPQDVIHWLESEGFEEHPLQLDDGGASSHALQDRAFAWVYDELTAEDGRNSLEGLGLICVEPRKLQGFLASEAVRGYIEEAIASLDFPWLDYDTYALFVRVCLESLRELGALEWRPGALDYKETKAREMFFCGTNEGEASQNVRSFVGSTIGAENNRSKFIRKYCWKVLGVAVTREQSTVVLKNLFDAMIEILEALGSGRRRYCEKHPANGGYRLNADLWEMRLATEDDPLFVCSKCGNVSSFDTGGVCAAANCDGLMTELDKGVRDVYGDYYRTIYTERALPVSVEEHTAQLSSEDARETQQRFIEGKVNVLSCTTTFELGVDVGDLRAIFMRNVPPTTANYAQRAGRTGRREGMPGYAVTYARLRPHDIEFYRKPERIIKGETVAPACYLENETILARHLYAIALSQFFRDTVDAGGEDYTKRFTDFLDLRRDDPPVLHDVRRYLASKPEAIERQLKMVVPQHVDDAAWTWIEDLVGDNGRLKRAHDLPRNDYDRLERAILERIEAGEPTGGLSSRKDSILKKGTINVLAERGVLPKYGFPTDVVELHLDDRGKERGLADLQLSRGLRQAIREYAPGAEVVAGKRLWRSKGLKTPKVGSLQTRYFGTCDSCKMLVWGIEDGTEKIECPTCKQEVHCHGKKLIEPLEGFVGELVESKRIGEKRPRTVSKTEIHFMQQWDGEAFRESVGYQGGSVRLKYAGNGNICILNKGRGSGYEVCSYCHAAAVKGHGLHHETWCKNKKQGGTPYAALGTTFTTDVLELTFDLKDESSIEEEDWRSLMWAIVAGAVSLLQIPESEIGATTYRSTWENAAAILLYDDVPGGAGRVLRLREQVEQLIDAAYRKVSECTCGVESCCYGCLCNYFNQREHASLSRGAALRILDRLRGGAGGGSGAKSERGDEGLATEDAFEAGASKGGLSIHADFEDSYKLEDEGFGNACRYALQGDSGENERLYIEQLASIGERDDLEIPSYPVVFCDREGNEADATLVWKRSKVVLLSAEAMKEFAEAFGPDYADATEYRFAAIDGSLSPENFAALLEER